MKKIKRNLQGRGGGGGGKGGGGGAAHIPVEAPDSLQSKAYAQILDLLAEGEIEGLVNGLQSVYLDGTPIENANGSRNFSGVEFDSRVGTQSQDYLPKISAVENEVGVGVQVTRTDIDNTGVTRTITNESIDAVRVRLSTPQLTTLNTGSGDLNGAEVEYTIELQSNGGGFQQVVHDFIIGKTTSKYERQYRIDLEGQGPWDIRVRRSIIDSVDSSVQNKLFWESYTEIIDGKLRYPNSALVSMKVDASQFSNVPSRGYDCKLLKIQIPYNATVRDDGSLTYSGTWDGTFKTAWSANPAWCFYDILSNTRYGLGNFIDPALIDKWSLYTIGQYCDELIDNGIGGTEPRFLCNLYLQSREEAFKVLSDMSSIFRAMTFWAGGTISLVQDSPSDPAHLFTPSNVVEGIFNYMGSSAKARHTVAVVTWNDPQNFFRQRVEYVEDQDAIARYGIIETEVVAFGCTSQGQANRLGRWLLYSERFQTETVTFKTGLTGSICRPGQVIGIADPVRAGSRRGGRISSATTDQITLDQTIDVPPGSTISILLPDGTVETRTIQLVDMRVVTVTSAFSDTAQNASVWTIQTAQVDSQYFKIISITEADDGTYEVIGLAHDPRKYAAIEQNLKLEPRSISALQLVPDAPSGLMLTETLYAVGADVRTKITISWNYVTGAIGYVVQYQKAGLNTIVLPETSTNEVELLNAEPGTYYATVYAVSAVGKRSEPATAQKTIRGKTAPPNDVTGFSLFPMAGVAYLSWDKSIDLDVLIGGSVRIRYTPDILDPEWKKSVDIVDALAGSATRANVPLLPGSYMAKFVDSSGIASDNEVIISTTIPEPLKLNVIETMVENPTFPGVKTDCFVTASFGGGLAMVPAESIDDWDMIDDVALWDFWGGVISDAIYEFENILDLGEVFTSHLTANIKVDAIDITETIDERTDFIDDWVDLDGEFIDDVNAELQVATSLDGMTFDPWKRFFVGDYAAQVYKFRLVMQSFNIAHNILIKELGVVVDVPDRTVNLAGLVSGVGTYAVVYDGAFHTQPAIGITAYNLNSGDFWEITLNTRSGFTIEFKDSIGNPVSRTFDVLAKGYGHQLS